MLRLQPAPDQSSTPGTSSAAGLRIALVTSDYHDAICHAMRDAAAAMFLDAGGVAEDLISVRAPGAFELIGVAAAAARRSDVHGVVTIGLHSDR